MLDLERNKKRYIELLARVSRPSVNKLYLLLLLN